MSNQVARQDQDSPSPSKGAGEVPPVAEVASRQADAETEFLVQNVELAEAAEFPWKDPDPSYRLYHFLTNGSFLALRSRNGLNDEDCLRSYLRSRGCCFKEDAEPQLLITTW